VLRNWDAIKQTEAGPRAGIFGEVPREPARAAVRAQGPAPRRLDRVRLRAHPLRGRRGPSSEELREARTREEAFHEVGDVLFAAVNVARKLKVDPELALRAAADRFRGRVEGAEGLAASEGADWNDLGPRTRSPTTPAPA
jgi:XTP/dITP diphosphohydrolase/tetrapyrrole methylase family protein/MazG family protein/ATP diphosphatase